MDTAKLILNQPVSLPNLLSNSDSASDAKKTQFAKDFESVFIHKLLDGMKNSICNWDDEKDGASEQMDGLFWMQMADHIADKGGFGMWKDIYQFVNDMEKNNNTPELLDKNL